MFLLVYIIVVRVVAPQCDERAQAQPVGKEDLSRCIQPHLSETRTCSHSRLLVYKHVCVIQLCANYLRPSELIEVWSDVEADAIYGSRQSDATEEQDEQHDVGIGG